MKVLLLLFIMATIPKVYGFDWRLHRSITGRALTPLGFSTNAIDEVADANINVDRQEGSHSASHADSEAFEAASSLMKSRLKIAAKAILSSDMKAARSTFGSIIHTAQDFYAHSNYVELMPGQAIDILNLTNPSSDISCFKHNGLTSGYYPDSSTPPKKCSHTMMNKDSGNKTPNGAKAMQYAESATAHMYALLEKEVLSMSANPQLSANLLTRFKEKQGSSKSLNTFIENDDVAFTSYNETFRISPFVGITQFSNNSFEMTSKSTAGLRIEARSNERFVTGLGFASSSSEIKENGMTKFDHSSYGLDLYGKLYFLSASRLQPYAGVGIGYLKNTLKQNSMQDIHSNSFNGELIGGLDLMFTKKIGTTIEFRFIKPLSASSYNQVYSQSSEQSVADRIAHEINNSNNLLASIGMIISF